MKIPTNRFKEVLTLAEVYCQYHDIEYSVESTASEVSVYVETRRQARHIKQFVQKRIDLKPVQDDKMFVIELTDDGWYCITVSNK